VPVKIYVVGEANAVEIIINFERFFRKFNFFVTRYTASGCINGKTVKNTFIDVETSRPVTMDTVDKKICKAGVDPY